MIEDTFTLRNARAYRETWPLAKPFVISRARADTTDVLVVEVDDGQCIGRGEACPIRRFGQSMEKALAGAEGMLAALRGGAEWSKLHDLTSAGAARNAVDCALWDLRAKRAGKPIWELLDLPEWQPVETVFTISVAAPEAMAAAARDAGHYPVLKIKLGGSDDDLRIRAIRDAVPDKRLIVDVNEGWSFAELERCLPAMIDARVELIEQPLPAGRDDELARLPRAARSVPIGADESCHTADDTDRLADLYDVVNIKLDKTGGLTEALRMLDHARAAGLDVMVGCMLGTSLAMAPAMLLAQSSRFTDLDAPLLIGTDRAPAMVYKDGVVFPPSPQVWG
ncbi:MAG TPA: N-acetyl-D-Glu racemase DgcA [Candidatus Limnocylindrales bacterium]|nr:N-acetyl-D-Glu racemase DgcA [Candidatus Limnocylindrales bacterium]